jgi:hypothetical protein
VSENHQKNNVKRELIEFFLNVKRNIPLLIFLRRNKDSYLFTYVTFSYPFVPSKNERMKDGKIKVGQHQAVLSVASKWHTKRKKIL